MAAATPTVHVPLSRPLVIYGLGGSGKTLSVLAMIERLHGKGEISKDRAVLYVCDNPEVLTYVCLGMGTIKNPSSFDY